VLTVLVSLATSVGLIELALRIHDGFEVWRATRDLPPIPQRAVVPSDDPDLIFAWRPGYQGKGFAVNAYGMPHPEISLAHGSVRRIAVAGDSISAHLELIPLDQTYVAELGRLLAPAEVLNFGVGGYSILQTARMLEQALRFEPDLLIAQLCLNDPHPTPGPYTPERSPHGAGLRIREHLLNRLAPDRYWAHRVVEVNYDAEGIANVRRGFDRLAEISRANAVPVVAVLFPYLYAPAYEEWGFDRYHAVFHDAARSAGVDLLDLRGAFTEAGLVGHARYPADRIHPDRTGHAAAAREIARALAARGW
jgi:lysophospholipase L1-like esterase